MQTYMYLNSDPHHLVKIASLDKDALDALIEAIEEWLKNDKIGRL